MYCRQRLPDGRAVLFTITSNLGGPPQIALLDLASGERKILVRGAATPRYVESGHLALRGRRSPAGRAVRSQRRGRSAAGPCRCSSNSH